MSDNGNLTAAHVRLKAMVDLRKRAEAAEAREDKQREELQQVCAELKAVRASEAKLREALVRLDHDIRDNDMDCEGSIKAVRVHTLLDDLAKITEEALAQQPEPLPDESSAGASVRKSNG